MSKGDETRIAELEMQVTFLEDSLQKLSDVLYKQQQRIDALELGIMQYEKRMKDIQQGMGETDNLQERPPHYFFR
ncbi:MAG: SlyX family protein [Pseudomonadales bacterium]